MSHYAINGETITEGSHSLVKTELLITAIDQDRDWELLKVVAKHDPETGEILNESLICKVRCDGVPSRNSIGIQYCERIAIVISRDIIDIPEVLALRKSFPITEHLNATLEDSAKSLCLYFEPRESVNRTWTAQKHLRRISWWLENTSKGTLHAADQPLEQLFFDSPWELVLPHDALDVQENDTRILFVNGIVERQRGHKTFTTSWLEPTGDHPPKITLINIKCPPVVANNISAPPFKFRTLLNIFSEKGIDLDHLLSNEVNRLVGQTGKTAIAESSPTIILVQSPIKRETDKPIEKTQYTAYLIDINYLEIGEKCGYLINLNGKYHRYTLLDGEQKPDLQNFSITPMAVLFEVSAKERQIQSNISEKSLNGAIVGAGALGSTIIDLFYRAGWGCWNVIDKDHIKPHNLVRHTAFKHQIGLPKSKAVINTCYNCFKSEDNITPFIADALDIDNQTFVKAYKDSEIVIDATASLDYPRLASTKDNLPRHVSIFLTPDGESSALLAEDNARSIRLATIESHYYRALINNDWGTIHLAGHIESYWTGGSCRDISHALPLSKVTSHAALLFDQIRQLQNQAVAKVWHENPLTGERHAYEIGLTPSIDFQIDEYKVSLDKELVQKLYDMRNRGLPAETGGILVGYHDFNVNTVVIVDVLPAPIDSQSLPTSFIRGTEQLSETVEKIKKRTANIVDYIGEWHSHPDGCSSMPSDHDLFQLASLAEKMALDGLPAYSLIVNESEIRILRGTVREK